ncbi:MAG: nitroreductase family protein [Gemmatimonadota bacterium]
MSYVSRVLSLARNRQVVKGFEERPVPLEVLARILECARYAPSAGEAQPWRFVVVRDPLMKHRIAAAAFNNPIVRSAGAVVVGCARIHTRVSGNGRPSHPVDLAAATQEMVVAAADVGLATSWITGFRETAIQELLGVPRDVPLVALLALGYPDGFSPLPKRRPRSEILAWETWDGTVEPA